MGEVTSRKGQNACGAEEETVPWYKIGACQGDLRICCILVPGLQRYLLPLVPRLHCYGDGIDANDGLVGTKWQFCSGTCIA